jgi:DNA topoisomerase-2
MHAFGAKGLMKKFNSVNDILSEFFVARLDLYHKRKQYQMKILQTKLEKEQHKIRFINLIVNQNLSFRNKTKGVLLTELEQLHFPSESHDYLLGMSLWSMTHDKIEQLKHEQLSTKNKLDTLKETPTQKLWLDDIAELQNCFETRKRSAAFSSDTNVSNKKRKR